MSGHSKWATIKRKKGATDAARGRLFTRLIKEITIAVRQGGGSPDGNPRLRLAIQTAKANNMPADNIKRAIQKGTGELPGTTYEEITYEGFAPGGVGVLVEVVTDNANRTVSEIRHIFSRNNGNLGQKGSVARIFQKMGTITLLKSKNKATEDDIMAVILDAGAEDMHTDGDDLTIMTTPPEFEAVKKAVEDHGITIESATLGMVPMNTVKVTGRDAENVMKLMEALEEHDDVQNVYANFDIDEKELATLNG
ncbi:MAG TPA: YebC/PmpR family DNA-binding transcriptional regulator [Bacteroidota bacterium]|nr:YebC/PmpR family DNA-binding transcriptional regulator [Bacteroidota bacterium]